jgi:MFS family permease
MLLKKFIGDRAFYKRVFAISTPIIIQNGITNFVNLLDNVMVGTLGTEAMSGVSIVNQFVFIFNLLIFGAMSAGGIFTAQYHGRGDVDGVRNTFRIKLLISLILSILGVAAFAAALGTGRTLYSKIGKNIHRALFLGAIGATLCYLTAALSPFGFLGLIACAFTGFCVSMLWPGSLIVASDYFPDGGVLIYALMAAGGDLGASVGPQLVGLITDFAIENPTIASLAKTLGLSAEQVGMKASMLVGMLFPLVAIPLFAYFKAQRKKASISEKK